MTGLIELANTAAAGWSQGMGAILVQSTVLVCIAFVLTRCLKRSSSAWRFWVWMLIPIHLLAMPLPNIPAPILPAASLESVAHPGTEATETATAPSVLQSAVPDESMPFGEPMALAPTSSAAVVAPRRATPALSGRLYLMLAWLAGAGFAAARLIRASAKIARVKAGARDAANPRVLELAQRAANMVGLAEAPSVLVTEDEVTPFVSGIRRPAIVLSTQFLRSVGEGPLLAVLAHECAHIRRRDLVWGFVLALCEVGFFFHPAFHWAKKRALREREQACDSWVLAGKGATRGSYARAILVAAQQGGGQAPLPNAYALAESFADLRQRLAAISAEHTPRPRLSVRSIVGLAALGLLCIPNFDLMERAQANVAPATVVAHDTHSFAAEVTPTEPITLDALSPEAEVSATAPIAGAVHSSAVPEEPATAEPLVVAAAPARRDVGTRILSFPYGRSVGRISIRDANKKRAIESYYHWIDGCEWQEYGEAEGPVSIPAGIIVKLALRPDGDHDWKWIRNLAPDALYNVTVLQPRESVPPIVDSLMKPLSSLTGLRELHLRYSGVTDRGFAEVPTFTQLERLWVPAGIGDAAMAEVAELPNLIALYLSYRTRVTASGLRHLYGLPQLRELELCGWRLDDNGLQHLAALPELEYLSLWGGDTFHDTAMRHVASVPSLRILRLAGGYNISNAGLRSIATLPNLERLSLYGVDGITNAGIAHLAKMPKLRVLDLNDPVGVPSPITAAGIAHLSQCVGLEKLLLPAPAVTDEAMAHVAQLKGLKYLWAGGGSRGALTDAGLKHIGRLSALEYLLANGGDGITDEGFAHLGRLGELRILNVMTDSPFISDEGIAHLAQLSSLTLLKLSVSAKHANVTTAGLNHLNALSELRDLTFYGVKRSEGDVPINLSDLKKLEKVAFSRMNGMDDRDLAWLAGMTQLKWLQGVDGITDEGMAHLAGLLNLERLNIRGVGLTDETLRYVGAMRKLTLVGLDGTFTEAGLRHLEGLTGLRVAYFSTPEPISDAAIDHMIRVLPNLHQLNSQPVGYGGGG